MSWVSDSVAAVLDIAFDSLFGEGALPSAEFPKLVMHGVPVWDGPGLYGWVSRGYSESQFTRSGSRAPTQKTGLLPVVEVQLLALWCHTDECMTDESELLGYGERLLEGLVRAVVDGTVAGACTPTQFVSMTPVGPSGGLAGWQVTMTTTR